MLNIENLEDPELRNLPTTKPYTESVDEQIFAGFDVGKKRHPSHLVIFRKIGDKVEQIHQSWLDGWSYSDQVEYLNEAAENFNITRGYVDNTRGELEDRGLDHKWRSMSFTLKSKNTMAHIFEQFVHSGNLKLLQDERQTQQILSVSNELKAPETPMGHGDAFFSVAMALQACHELSQDVYTTVGSATDWLEAVSPGEQSAPKASVQIEATLRGKKDGIEDLESGDTQLSWNDTNQLGAAAPNPDCQESICVESFWVKANNLCLYCGYRG